MLYCNLQKWVNWKLVFILYNYKKMRKLSEKTMCKKMTEKLKTMTHKGEAGLFTIHSSYSSATRQSRRRLEFYCKNDKSKNDYCVIESSSCENLYEYVMWQ